MRRYAAGLVIALMAIVLAVGCSNTRADQSITTDIKARMFSDAQFKTANIDVSTRSGIATLSGTVADEAAHYGAVNVARGTPGVKDVIDQISVAPAQVVQAAPLEPPVVTRTLAPPKTRSNKSTTSATKTDSDTAAEREPISEPPPAAYEPASTESTGLIASPPVATPEPRQVEIPAGTQVRVQMIDSVDTSVNHAGEMFHASLDAPVVLDNEVVVPAGTDVYLKLVSAESAGKLTGKSQVTLQLDRMEFQGKTYNLESEVYEQSGASRGKGTAAKVGGGAAVGALLGAVLGKGKGAAIGAAAGAGAGTVAQAASKAEQVRIETESKLDFTLTQPVEVSYFPEQNRRR